VTGPDSTTRGGRARLVGVDVARALALLGMMATHILLPVTDGSLAWPQALAGGRSSALFALLAGVSMALVTGGSSPHGGMGRLGDSVALTSRALLIGLLGLFLGQLETPVAVILTYYAVLFVLGLPFLGLGPRPLLALAALWCAVVPVLSHAARAWLGPGGPTVPTAESVASLAPFLLDLTLTGYYPALPWLTYLLAGMALGRMDLARPATAAWVAGVGATVAAGAWALSRALTSQPGAQDALVASSDSATSWDQLSESLALGLHGVTPTGSWWWLAVAAPHSGTPLDLAHTAGCAAAVLGVCLLLARWRPRLWAVAFGAGAMTLTLYTAHVVLLTPDLWPGQSAANYARHASLALATGAAVAWLGRRGPLESLVRRASGMTARAVTGSSAGPSPRPPAMRSPHDHERDPHR
jgi:uncharacterized membrane protein